MKSRYVLLSLLVAPLLFAGCKMGSLLGTDSTPSQLTVGGPTSDSLIVRWTPVAGAVSYEVFRDTLTTGVFGTRAYHGGATSFADSGLAAGTTYFYKVQATTPAGSGPLSAVASGRTIPPAPEGLTAGESTTISLTVTWTAANGAESYSLFRDSTTGLRLRASREDEAAAAAGGVLKRSGPGNRDERQLAAVGRRL